LRLLQVLDRSTYGWVEYVEHLPLSDHQAATRYYQRAGMLLGILYALSGADFHHENIIASGEQPVLIDLEMLMSAIARKEESLEAKSNASSMAFEQFTYSVLSTSFLPSWETGGDGQAYDISGLGGSGGQRTQFRRLVWKNINTDGMVLGHEDAKTTSNSNLPMLNDIYLSPGDYVEELCDGFRQIYQVLLTHREALLAASPLVKLAHQRIRAIFRPTQVYASLLKETLQPKFLRNGVERSMALDVLCKPFLRNENKPHSWQIIAAEQRAMEQLDIPLFTTHPHSDDLKIGSHQFIDRYFVEPSYDLVVTRLRGFNADNLEQQLGFIRNSLYASIADETKRPLSLSKPAPKFDATILSGEVLVQQAIAIALELQKHVVRATDGSVTWMGLDYMPQSGRLQQKPMGYDFYDGSSGVALFLSALVKVTGNEAFRDLALGALQSIHPLFQNLSSGDEKSIQKIGIGGGKGLSSIVYTLVRCSQFLAEPMLLKDAQRIASLITPDRITKDHNFDLMSGSAGAILGLLTLHQAIADPAVLEQAITCGHHLLNHRTASHSGLRTWATLNEKLLTGLSHGASGIAYALLRLYETTQDAVFLDAATEAIAYERSVFSAIAQNWPDFRSEKPRFLNSWCHGAAGIGLARLGSLAILDTDDIRQDIEMALHTTQQLGVHEIDHLCCGNFGRIETLLVGAQQLGRSELSKTAHKQAAWAVHRAEINGSFQIFPNLFKGAYNPGFFQGTAGIGYELLRLAYPEKLPSALLWK
jgi:type 2 lantibiotic biosynthesis protein LanM